MAGKRRVMSSHLVLQTSLLVQSSEEGMGTGVSNAFYLPSLAPLL